MHMPTICFDVSVPGDPIYFRLREVQTACQLSHASIQSNCQNKSCFWSADVFSLYCPLFDLSDACWISLKET